MRIQDLCKGGGPAEILPTSRIGVTAAVKIWASKWGAGGGGERAGPPGPPARSAPEPDLSPSYAASIVDHGLRYDYANMEQFRKKLKWLSMRDGIFVLVT